MAAVELAPGVWRIPTAGHFFNSFAFVDAAGAVTLVDAGLRGATRRIEAGLAAIGRRPEDVTRILVTHAHPDHIGSARTVRAHTHAPLAVHDEDASFVRQGRMPPRDATRPLARVASFVQRRQPRCDVDDTFSDGDLLPVAGGLRVLHTPGHTPGHCAFLHEPSGVLITGDAIMNVFGRRRWNFVASCTDYQMSRGTAERLGEADYDVAAFTHGYEIRRGAREAVRAFLRRSARGR
ncbi:MAG TPA: MBL fold metallo-hydrolase [Acidimicrobiales bacterium]|nr:MBL fold metallo-hydrolase [Acidimicrobiales bacterium]